MNYSILVNKDNPLDVSFDKIKLVSVGKHFIEEKGIYGEQDILLEEETAYNLKMFLNMVNKIDINKQVIPNSGYRDILEQQRVMDYYIEEEGLERALKRVSIPGTSEHHTGLAIDLVIIVNNKYLIDVIDDNRIFDCLVKNAYKYGFILRYPSDKINITGIMYEPWHFRYVGFELAKYLYFNNLTLEEYYGYSKVNNYTLKKYLL